MEVASKKRIALTWDNLFKHFQTYSLVLIVLGMGIILSMVSSNFLTVNNLRNVALQISIIGILATGITMVIITGGIDLSVGSVLALTGVIAGRVFVAIPGVNMIVPILAAIAVGLFVGVINSLFITYGKMPPFIVTLGMMGIARGFALVFTAGYPIWNLPGAFVEIGNGRLFGIIPYPFIIMIVIMIICDWFLRNTILGRNLYAIGSNTQAAVLSGINVKKSLISVYAIMGALSAVAGIVLSARMRIAEPMAGVSYELDAITAAIIGGTAFTGGVGTIKGTFLGVIIMGIVRNGLILLDVSSFWQQVAIGSILLVAVLIDSLKR